MADFYIKRHDTSPSISGTVLDGSGNTVDLTGATAKFIMVAVGGGTPKINAAGTIPAPATGGVAYAFISADTDTAGDYQGEFEVTLASGKKQTFPDPGYIAITITPDLDNA